MEDKDRFVDDLLDSALARQPEAKPRAGLEGRILEHVRAASERSSRKRLWVAITATAAAAFMVAAIYVARHPHRVPVKTSQTANAVPGPSASETLTANSEAAPKAGPATRVIEPKRVARRQTEPSRRGEAHHWPSQFPTPAPLSPEEKALVQYVQNTPPQVLATPILKPDSTIQRVQVKPLEIPPLEIQPLAVRGPSEQMQ